MEWLDTLKLATLGYKPDKIKELSDSGIDSKTIIELSKNGYSAEDMSELLKLKPIETDKVQPDKTETIIDKSSEEGEKDNFDYKKEIADRDKEIEELKKTVEKIQLDNAHHDSSDKSEPSPAEKTREALRNLY